MKWRSGTLDDLYFEWLYEQIMPPYEFSTHSYWNLTRELYCIEFTHFVPNDHNRATDGLEMRTYFLDMEGWEPDEYWETLPCSMLEMLVALARRLEFEGGDEDRWNFWMFMENMGLAHLDDTQSIQYIRGFAQKSSRILVERQYAYSGIHGGLFPLDNPEEDQRDVELWYQMAAYLREGRFSGLLQHSRKRR